MTIEEMVDEMLLGLPEGMPTGEEKRALLSATRMALQFGQFLSGLQNVRTVKPEATRVARQIEEGLEILAGIRKTAASYLADMTQYEKLEYANDSTVAGTRTFFDVRDLARTLVDDFPTAPLEWRTYRNATDLAREYDTWLAQLQTPELPSTQRLVSLLEMCRLQIVFLANTYC